MRILSQVKRILSRLVQEYKYYRMDQKYYSFHFHCWDLFPPSFYVRYTPEEQKRIIDCEIAELRAMLEQYCRENGIESPVNDSGPKL